MRGVKQAAKWAIFREHLESGATLEASCVAAGVSHQAVYLRIKKGDEELRLVIQRAAQARQQRREERIEQRVRSLSRGASLAERWEELGRMRSDALQVLEDIMRDPTAPIVARGSAAKQILVYTTVLENRLIEAEKAQAGMLTTTGTRIEAPQLPAPEPETPAELTPEDAAAKWRRSAP